MWPKKSFQAASLKVRQGFAHEVQANADHAQPSHVVQHDAADTSLQHHHPSESFRHLPQRRQQVVIVGAEKLGGTIHDDSGHGFASASDTAQAWRRSQGIALCSGQVELAAEHMSVGVDAGDRRRTGIRHGFHLSKVNGHQAGRSRRRRPVV